MINLVVVPYVPRRNCCCESPPINLEKEWDLNLYIISLVVMLIDSIIILWYFKKQEENLGFTPIALLFFTLYPIVNTLSAVVATIIIIVVSLDSFIKTQLKRVKDKKERKRLKKIDDEMNEFEDLIEQKYNENRKF